MTRLLKRHETNYPGLFTWMRDVLPAVPTSKPAVWSKFLEYSLLQDADARSVLAYGQGPLVFVQTIDGIPAYFDRLSPDTINLSTGIAGTTSLPDANLVESTLLHELVHWAYAKDGRTEEGEQGYAFETAAYGVQSFKELHTPADDEGLGDLSRRWESGGNPGAIGRDTNGGWSYGLYQLSSRQGRVGEFIDFLDRLGRTRGVPLADFARALRDAGGDTAARQGEPGFHQAWKRLAVEPAFSDVQHEFIRATHYEPFVTRLVNRGIDLRPRPLAVRDVAWSVSVQHGPGATQIFEKPWVNLTAQERADDARVIRAVYQERGRVDVYFRNSNQQERESVARRFEAEEAAALAMLA